MRRYLSVSKSNRNSVIEGSSSTRTASMVEKDLQSSTDVTGDNDTINGDDTGTGTSAALAPPNTKVKRLDWYYSTWSKTWKYKNMGSRVVAETRVLGAGKGGDNTWKQYCFVIIRRIPHNVDLSKVDPTFEVVVESPYLLKACKEVIGSVPGISWNADPLHLDAKLLVAFVPLFEVYRDELKAKSKKQRTDEEDYILTTVNILLDYLHTDYRSTLSTIKHLTSHGEITFDLLFALLVPHSTFVTTCPVTGEPQALQLVTSMKRETMVGFIHELTCEYMEAVDSDGSPGSMGFGRVERKVHIMPFAGTVKINSLEAFPIRYHDRGDDLKALLIERGRKWVSLDGIHHMHYSGTGAVKNPQNPNKVIKYNLNSRIMIDRANFRRVNPNYVMPTPKMNANNVNIMAQDEYVYQESYGITRGPSVIQPGMPRGANIGNADGAAALKSEAEELTDEELMLASPIVYGFSLADKLWLEFNVQHVIPIQWNDEAFSNLVLPADRKALLQSLVEAHNDEIGFDDFIRGKGQGLVVNLFGPPGVGKTLSAEATSEHVRRPLYVVGAGDLGTQAALLDSALTMVFDIATSWKAIVLIDESDVFLEQRTLHDLERNAMVAVFLRHLEYYRGILFLTTNRVKTFDEAFLSRIHIALRFQSLSAEAKEQVWSAFLAKVGCAVGTPDSSVSREQLSLLATRDINGREIKNAVRTAMSLAAGRKETVSYAHLNEVLGVLQQFSDEFAALKQEK